MKRFPEVLAIGFPGFPIIVYIATGVILASWFILKCTVVGLYIYAVGGNEEAARQSGINVRQLQLLIDAVSGFCTGIASVMVTSRFGGANGLELGQSYELDAIAAVILGGVSFVGDITPKQKLKSAA